MDGDLIGTVRREDHHGGCSIWVRLVPDATPGNEWTCVWSTFSCNIDCTMPHSHVLGFPVIGAVPGTPAAAGLLAAPAVEAPFTDLTARLAAADAGWSLKYGDPPSNPDYIRWLAAQVDAFEGHVSPAAPAEVSRDAYRDERDATQRELDAARGERNVFEHRWRQHGNSLLQRRQELDLAVWLRAEAVWQLAIVRRYLDRPIKVIAHNLDPKSVGHVVDGSGEHQGWVDNCQQCRDTATSLIDSWRLAGTGVGDRESRFRWAEEAAALQAKLDLPCGSCHPCVNWDAGSAPEDAEEALTAALEAHQSAIVTMDDAGPEFDAQYAAHLALDLVRSWRPATERNEGH